MSSQQYNAGQSHGHSQAKTEQWVESAKNTAHDATNKAENMAQNAQHKAQHGSDQGGILQQTGEQMASMAQGAIDGVKNTLGIGDNNNNKK